MNTQNTEQPKKPDTSGPTTPISPETIKPLLSAPQESPTPEAVVSPEPGGLIEVSDLLWERVVEKSEKPVAVMFYSTTCPYCRIIEPYFIGYAKEFKDTVIFARLNIMSSMWTAERYAVRGTPTFKFFCGGKPVFEIVGAVFPAILKKMVEEVLVHGKECAGKVTEINYEITGYG
jgi:thiol-disulfide isomerase/thioredoxin